MRKCSRRKLVGERLQAMDGSLEEIEKVSMSSSWGSPLATCCRSGTFSLFLSIIFIVGFCHGLGLISIPLHSNGTYLRLGLADWTVQIDEVYAGHEYRRWRAGHYSLKWWEGSLRYGPLPSKIMRTSIERCLKSWCAPIDDEVTNFQLRWGHSRKMSTLFTFSFWMNLFSKLATLKK